MSELPLLFVTSFNKELYDATGRKLIQTYYQSKSEANFFVAYEDNFKQEDTYKLTLYDLTNDKFLKNWLESNADIIPEYLGGDAIECNCPNPYGKRDCDHNTPNCHFSWWNRNCSRWFRKVAAIKKAIETFPATKYLIWLDSDVLFKQTIVEKFIRAVFENEKYSTFYHQGKRRRVSECGIVGYNLAYGGKEFITKFTQYYTSGEFREWRRWDDSYVFDKTRIGLGAKFRHRDCAQFARQTRVIDVGILNKHFAHLKGTHGEKLGIMK